MSFVCSPSFRFKNRAGGPEQSQLDGITGMRSGLQPRKNATLKKENAYAEAELEAADQEAR
jgi:hypothetical protein